MKGNKFKRFIASLLLLSILVAVIEPLPVYASIADKFTVTEDGANIKVKVTGGNTITLTVPNENADYYSTGEDSYNNAKDSFGTAVAAQYASDGLGTTDSDFMSAIASQIPESTVGADNKVLRASSVGPALAALLYCRMFPDALSSDGVESSYEKIVNYAISSPSADGLKAVVNNITKVETLPDKAGYSGGISSSAKSYRKDATFKIDKNSKEFFATEYAIRNLLKDYLTLTDWAVETAGQANWETESSNTEVLNYITKFTEIYDGYIPFLADIYKAKLSDTVKIKVDGEEVDLTFENMCKAAGADAANAVTPDATNVTMTGSYSANYDKSTPIGNFYTINSDSGIVSYDRDKVLSTIEVNTMLDEVLKDRLELNENNNNVEQENIMEEENILTADEGSALLGQPSDKAQNLREILNGDAVKDHQLKGAGVDADGLATTRNAVTINDYIVRGMTYSTTFIPMRTNMYSPEVVGSFDEDFRNEFFYKYGFMRKALYKDTSATAVMDYYNANGQFTGSATVCTLRDLIESNGEDVVLYIDQGFYNGDQAMEQGQELLDSRNLKLTELSADLDEYAELWDDTSFLSSMINFFKKETDKTEEAESDKINLGEKIKRKYEIDMSRYSNVKELREAIDTLDSNLLISNECQIDDNLLKDNNVTLYSNNVRNHLARCDQSDYYNLDDDASFERDSMDSIVLSSKDIKHYMDMKTKYSVQYEDESGEAEVTNTYTSTDTYTPLLSLAYVSTIYRNSDLFTLANTVVANNPVYMASDDMCSVTEANQWYRNTLLNFILLQNLKSAAQVDYQYVTDLDSPVYMDIFGNILTESGTVVIPAACNATLHTGDFCQFNVGVGTYCTYGKDYAVPVDLDGAYSVLTPYFVADLNSSTYVINNVNLTLNGNTVDLGDISQYTASTQEAVQGLYQNCIVDGKYTDLNWMAMVNIANEVMRGAPVENIDAKKEGLDTIAAKNKAGVLAASKLESLIDSLQGAVSTTLVHIPDFTKMDNMEFVVALLIKLMIVATAAVIIVYVYRDGVSGTLGLRTLWKSLAAIALTFSCIVVVPMVFQLTYYSANKMLLQNECYRILMLNTDKRELGVEIGVTETDTITDVNDFSLQLDWITVPWYEQLEDLLYGNSYKTLKKTKLEAYRKSEVYANNDVTLYNDGVYITSKDLFDSVSIDYTFSDASEVNGLYIYSNNKYQTAGFYSPYYAFLRVLVGNVNEYNAKDDGTYNYTTKYMSGNRLKTVGLCYNYFTSTQFMGTELEKASREDSGVDSIIIKDAIKTGQEDIMHLYQIYSPTMDQRQDGMVYEKKKWVENKDKELGRALLFDDASRSAMANAMWYNELEMDDMVKRVEIMDTYAREFVVNNRDLLNKVTDETFIKVMALAMSIKYNQLFGINAANSLEIYNMDSNDILRLSIAKADEAVLAAPMSYARFVYNFGGEPAVYAATVLEMIMWVGSFIKPLCTVIVFISVFLSIWVFRVVLRRPSHNLWGYLVTITLLCATNFVHALLIKLSVKLPAVGLPTFGCLIFLIVAQVAYLLFLSYVVGVSLRDWYNLGSTEYEDVARNIKSKFSNDAESDLSGRVKHHDNNWEYYDDLIDQHRARNAY